MNIAKDQAILLIRRFCDKGDKPKKYRSSYEVTDESTGQFMASGDLTVRRFLPPARSWIIGISVLKFAAAP